MAEGLARTILDCNADVESAGISPSRGRATYEAIELMQKGVSIDISGHRPRSVTDIELDRFDSIIALDSYLYGRLKEDHRIDSGRLIQWDIDDPYGVVLMSTESVVPSSCISSASTIGYSSVCGQRKS